MTNQLRQRSMSLLGVVLSGAVCLATSQVQAAEGKSAAAGEGGSGSGKRSGEENKPGAEDPHTCQHAAKLRAEIESLKDAVSALEAQVKSVDERTVDATTHSDLEALRDIEEENILRSVGSSSAVSPHPVNGGLQHRVNLTGSSALLYTATPRSTSDTWRVLKLQASYTRLRQEAFTGARNQIDVNLQGSF